jgi:hypothetical protein
MATIGEERVRISFNPSANSVVDQVKQKTAELIDMCQSIRPTSKDDSKRAGEINRLLSLAQTHYEDAAMWAVKAATAP